MGTSWSKDPLGFAIDTAVWKRDVELVTGEFEEFGRVHIWAAWLMAGKRPLKLPDGTWTYPNSTELLDEVGLKTIAHYIGVRRQHVASYIVDKPIFLSCMDGVRRRGSSVHQFWLTQPMNLEAARAARLAGPVVVSGDEGD